MDACFLKQARAVAGSSDEADLRAEGIAMKAALASAEAELAQLRRGPAKDVPAVEGPPRLVLAALKRALEALLLDGGRITNQQAAALDDVLAELVLKGYTVMPFTEQSIVNAVVDQGVEANGRQICESMPRMTNPRLLQTVKKAMRIWNGAACEVPMVSYRRQSKKGDRGRGGRYSLFTCDCGDPITTVGAHPRCPAGCFVSAARCPTPIGGQWTRWFGSRRSTACCRHRANRSRRISSATVVVATPSESAQPRGWYSGSQVCNTRGR